MKSNEVYNALLNSSSSNTTNAALRSLRDELLLPETSDWFSPFNAVLSCIMCRAAMRVLITFKKLPNLVKLLINMVCVFFQIVPREVCNGLVDLNVDIILYIINQKEDITPARFCGTVLQSEECTVEDPALEWTVNVDLGEKPNMSTPSNMTEGEIVTIVHISDIHHDPSYTPGGNADCGKPTCCRSDQGNASTPEGAAGYWLDYRKCDMPLHAIQDMLDQIKTQHKNFDYLYMTGDLVDHGVWETSRERNTKIIDVVMKTFKEILDNTPVFPAMGNHESHPTNVLAPPEITDESMSTKWLYETVADLWTLWLPKETRETILQGGYYTLQVRPGFRLVVLNNIVCYTLNWWVLYDSKDPGGQLKWLAETLLQAEKDGEKVHILAHIPPGNNDCLKIYSREFSKIIDRFENTVTAQFNGHTHVDEFHIFYDLQNQTRANNVAFDGGSGTPHYDINPNYRVYSVDSSTWQVIDFEMWVYNITAANLQPDKRPSWYKLYTFTEAYGVKSVSPVELDKLAHRMARSPELIQQFYRFSVKDADPSLSKGCNKDCMKDCLCKIVTSQVGDKTQCKQLVQEFETQLIKNNKL